MVVKSVCPSYAEHLQAVQTTPMGQKAAAWVATILLQLLFSDRRLPLKTKISSEKYALETSVTVVTLVGKNMGIRC